MRAVICQKLISVEGDDHCLGLNRSSSHWEPAIARRED